MKERCLGGYIEYCRKMFCSRPKNVNMEQQSSTTQYCQDFAKQQKGRRCKQKVKINPYPKPKHSGRWLGGIKARLHMG
jgi:hypothetical protein